jgi:hypothetical protein
MLPKPTAPGPPPVAARTGKRLFSSRLVDALVPIAQLTVTLAYVHAAIGSIPTVGAVPVPPAPAPASGLVYASLLVDESFAEAVKPKVVSDALYASQLRQTAWTHMWSTVAPPDLPSDVSVYYLDDISALIDSWLDGAACNNFREQLDANETVSGADVSAYIHSCTHVPALDSPAIVGTHPARTLRWHRRLTQRLHASHMWYGPLAKQEPVQLRVHYRTWPTSTLALLPAQLLADGIIDAVSTRCALGGGAIQLNPCALEAAHNLCIVLYGRVHCFPII